MRNVFLGFLLFSLGLVSGQKLMVHAYNPVALEDAVLAHTKVIYAAGCSEGLSAVTGKKDHLLFCLDLAGKVVKDQEDIIRNKAWSK